MKNVISFLIMLLISSNFDVGANCNFKNPNEVLKLIKKNHPIFLINNQKIKVIEQSIEQAKQRPNPELNSDLSIGDSIDGKVYTSTLSLQHRFELGGKRDSRIKVAKNYLKTSIATIHHENQHVLIKVILELYRLRQIYDLIPLYNESLVSFKAILKSIGRSVNLSPEQEVEKETISLILGDYKLKISRLKSEKVNLNKHLAFFMGVDCQISQKMLPKSIDLKKDFSDFERKGSHRHQKYLKYLSAKYALNLAQSNLKLQKSNGIPNLLIGPSLGYEKLNLSQTNTFGISITMDLPVFNMNGAAKLKALNEIKLAEINLKNIERESELDLQAWVLKYNKFRRSLKLIAGKLFLERKHKKIEGLFKRGIISTSLVIESHRQLIEFTKTRFEFEQSILEALWNIYKISGVIDSKPIN